MAFPGAMNLSVLSPTSPDEYDSSCSSTDSEGTARNRARPRAPFLAATPATIVSGSPQTLFLFPPNMQSGHSSVSSTASSTPLPSRSTSPLPQFYASNPSSSSPSDSESEPNSPLIRANLNRNPWWRENRRPWWTFPRRRRKRDGRIIRILKKWTRRVVRHPFFPGQPITIVLTLILLSCFAIFLTLLLIYILNPDKEPLPWRAYCSAPSTFVSLDASQPHPNITTSPVPFPPTYLDALPPAGVFVGVFSVDSAFERRMLVRSTWASHPKSREGAGEGDEGFGTSRSIVRFILGQPKKDWERRIKLEIEMYNDIVILPVQENMNSGKTHTFFSWASINAWVPPIYLDFPASFPQLSYANSTSSPPPLASHDPYLAWVDMNTTRPKPWVRPDFVVKVDDDSFVMLAELESRLRVELHAKPGAQHKSTIIYPMTDEKPLARDTAVARSLEAANDDPLIYWGYFVSNRLHQFMAGELYALSWSLVDWVAKDSTVKTLTRGAEDKQTAKWMRLHPRAQEVRWASERCWVYDHPRSGTVYSHGFLFPSEVTRIKHTLKDYLERYTKALMTNTVLSLEGTNMPTSADLSHSTVSTFGVRYTPPIPDLSASHSIEALVEGSDMSLLREGSPMTPEYAWAHREGRIKRYEGQRIGGTVAVHFIKKHMWFLETALALLEGEELSESESYEKSRMELLTQRSVQVPPRAVRRVISRHRRS